MALNPRSVQTVREFFKKRYPDHNENQYGADEVYIQKKGSVQTSDMQEIVDTSRKIGNTVSVIPEGEFLTICFW